MLLAVPALRALRQRWPDDPLAAAAQPKIGGLLKALGIADRSIDFETLGLDALFQVEPEGAEPGWPARCADDLRRATRVVAWIGSREPQFVRRLAALIPGAVVAPSVGAGRPVWEHLLDTVGATAPERTLRAPLEVPAQLAAEARRALLESGWDGHARLLVVHPGAGGRGKRWPAAGFAAVLEQLVVAFPRLAVVIHQGPADAEAVAALSTRLARRMARLREPALPLLAGALSHATAYLGNDSGISHLAGAVGVRSVVLFTADRILWRPWGERAEPRVVSVAALDEADVARVTDVLAPLLE